MKENKKEADGDDEEPIPPCCKCSAMRCDEVVGGALPCFSQIQGSSLVSVCVWFMRKIEGPKEVGRSSRAAAEGKRLVEEGRCRRRAVRCDVGRVFRLLDDLPCRHAASGCREASSQCVVVMCRELE